MNNKLFWSMFASFLIGFIAGGLITCKGFQNLAIKNGVAHYICDGTNDNVHFEFIHNK
jgi:hypothetical protein